jgi:uncharacterized membrane protein
VRIYAALSEWINLAARWAHIFAAILWVGSTYLFTWLDGRFEEASKAAAGGDDKQVWMVHSGGFYVVEKRKGLDHLTRTLHWFRWEAAFTWLTGMVLLVVVYYLGGGMVDPDARVQGGWQGAAVGLGVIVAAGFVYDVLVQSPLGKNERLFAVVAFALIVVYSYALTRIFTARAAFLHAGAAFGTIMAANVWMHILPAQRRMLAALREGRRPDEALAARAKLRSKHNTFIVIPVVFTMISHHYAFIGDEYNWAILSALVLVGWLAAKIIRRA